MVKIICLNSGTGMDGECFFSLGGAGKAKNLLGRARRGKVKKNHNTY